MRERGDGRGYSDGRTLQEKSELETNTYSSLNRDGLETDCIQTN